MEKDSDNIVRYGWYYKGISLISFALAGFMLGSIFDTSIPEDERAMYIICGIAFILIGALLALESFYYYLKYNEDGFISKSPYSKPKKVLWSEIDRYERASGGGVVSYKFILRDNHSVRLIECSDEFDSFIEYCQTRIS